MVNPLKTEHAIDWRMTMQEIEDQFQAGMVERDRYKEALVEISRMTPIQCHAKASYIAEIALTPEDA